MDYRTSIDLFKTKYEIELVKSKLKYPTFQREEIMMLLSEVQARLGNTYKLYEKSATLDLTVSVYQYTVGTGASNIPKDLLMIKEMIQNGATLSTATINGEPLTRVSKEDMDRIIKQNGSPGRYTLYGIDSNMVFEIDTSPDKSYADDSSYRINYIYIGRLELFNPSDAGTSNSISFSDWDISASGYGGNWKLPLQWHPLIIEGAIANIFDYRAKEFEAKVLQAYQSTPKVVTRHNKYFLGIPNK